MRTALVVLTIKSAASGAKSKLGETRLEIVWCSSVLGVVAGHERVPETCSSGPV